MATVDQIFNSIAYILAIAAGFAAAAMALRRYIDIKKKNKK